MTVAGLLQLFIQTLILVSANEIRNLKDYKQKQTATALLLLFQYHNCTEHGKSVVLC